MMPSAIASVAAPMQAPATTMPPIIPGECGTITRAEVPAGASAVAAVIPGPNSPEQAACNLQWFRTPIPADLWSELKVTGLILSHPPTPS